MQPAKLRTRRLGDRCIVRHVDDRREDAVDVEQDRRPAGVLGEPREQGGVAVHPPRIRAVPLKLLGIGLVAGFFSALFGVGGGIVIGAAVDPLARLPEPGGQRHLAGGDRDHGACRNDPLRLRGPRRRRARGARRFPAAAGEIVGTGLQQRVSGRALTLAFAGLLAALAVWLLLA